MDILDILIAKNKSFTGETEKLTREAKEAVNKANEAIAKIEGVEGALAVAQEAKTAADNAVTAIKNIASIDVFNSDTETEKVEEVSVTKNGTTKKAKFKAYKNAGDNEDGTMTQKAIKAYVSSQSASNLGPENVGTVVVVGEDGQPQAGEISEASIIRTEILAGTYETKGALGLEIDYENKTFRRVQESASFSMGTDFDKYPIYGGIKRCLVDDNGEIIAFADEDIYEDNFSNGYQTMVYIPKFYYIRVPVEMSGAAIKKEIIMISATAQKGFKIHPAFIENGEELDYILYSAYEGSTFDVGANAYNRNDSVINFTTDKLSSIVEAKPISGVNNDLTRDNAEKLANNRGSNWHITNIKAESAIQMLSIIEFGILNSQRALGKGICYIDGILGYNCSSYTGSTSALKNQSGAAMQTINEINGNETIYNNDGYVAISYRGIENPWGNLRRFISGIEIRNGNIPYILENDNYVPLNFTIPSASDWISKFGYAGEKYDWLFIPTEAKDANSNLPIGDYVDVNSALTDIKVAAIGGHWGFKENDGLFNYSFDRAPTYASRAYGARLMYIPTKDAIYYENIAAWKASIGG